MQKSALPPKPDTYSHREWVRIQQREMAERRRTRNLILIICGLLLAVILLSYEVWFFVIRSHDKDMLLPFDLGNPTYGIRTGASKTERAESFAENLCVVSGDVNADAVFMTATVGALFDVNGGRALYARNVFEKRPPASLTKIMTALVAMKYGNLEEIVTVTPTAMDIEQGSSVCLLNVGDRLTLKQLVYGLLIASGNDAAMMIAEHVGGSVSQFVAMMNQEAKRLGCTQTNFMNPHGLTAEGHYTSAYDIYLMFNEALKYETFQDIIGRKNYYAEYQDKTGDAYAITWDTTDHYLSGEAVGPDNVVITGGKTGTTQAAGACLALLSKDVYGNPFISIIMNSEDKEQLYTDMNQILSLVGT
jgi:D-alanyl-D-alanine carboxypeptidase